MVGAVNAADRPGVAAHPAQGAGFDLSPYPAVILSEQGLLVAANTAAEELYAQALRLFARRPMTEALPPGDMLPQLIERARATRMVVRERSAPIRLPDHAPFEAEATATPLPDGGLLLTLFPSNAIPAAERRAETLRSAAGMGRTLAHEIKNPLAGIRGAAQLLRSAALPDDVALAQLIIDETDRIRRLVDRVEAFSDERAPDRRPVNIHRVLDRVRALIAASIGDGVVFREAYDPSLPHASGDEDQMIQVFLNLLKNAAEAVAARGDGRGEILIATAYRHDARVRGEKAAVRAPLEVRIQDNGPGVDPWLREHLFEPFVTGKAQGTGLGLTLVAKLVAAHDGRIEFESEPGRTVFRVRLPVETAVTHGHTPGSETPP